MHAQRRLPINILTGTAIFVVLMTCLAATPAQADEWHWIRLQPDLVNNKWGWFQLEGLTDVKVTGHQIEFEMKFQDDKYMYIYDVTGTVVGKTVAAKEIHEYTDASPRPLEGTIEGEYSKASSFGWDRIILRDDDLCIILVRAFGKTNSVVKIPK